MKPAAAGAIAICVAAALWGLDGVVLTPRLFNLQVPFAVFLLHAVPFVLMQPFLFQSYRAIARMDSDAWLALFLVALLGGAVGTLAMVQALFLVRFDHLSIVVLLQKLQPVFAILLAALVLKERITGRFLEWTAAALAGAYLLAFGLALPRFSASTAAVLLALVAAASFGAGTVFSKRLVGKLDFRDATFARFGLTALLLFPYLLAFGGLGFSAMTGANWLVLLLIAATTGGGAIFLYYWGLRKVPASVSTVCELCLPLSAILFDYLVNGSVLSAAQWVGAAVLTGAIVRISMLQGEVAKKRSA